MEFLGDAVLDMLVVNELFFNSVSLSHIEMHHYKSSAVNGNFLAYLCLGYSMNVKSRAVENRGGNNVAIVSKDRKVDLWKFVRHQHQMMGEAQRQCWKRYDGGLRDIVQTTLESGDHYPWTELTPLESDHSGKNKFLSDIIEAIIGAVFVDSGGRFDVAKNLAERLGMFKVLRRLVSDRVDVTHPVKKLGETVAADGQGTLQYLQDVEQGEYSCAVLVNGEELLKVRASGRVEARTKAADIALGVYLKRQSLRKLAEAEAATQAEEEGGIPHDQKSGVVITGTDPGGVVGGYGFGLQDW
jgi:dsRNA-specific ribonuclease